MTARVGRGASNTGYIQRMVQSSSTGGQSDSLAEGILWEDANVQPELDAVSYPLFAYTFLNLVNHGFAKTGE